MRLSTWILIGIIIIQAILLFFKNALNQIIVDWYKHKKERKLKVREDLIKVYQYLRKMYSDFIPIFFLDRIIKYANISERQVYYKYQKRALDRFSESQNSVNEISIRLPKNIRKIVDGVLSEMTLRFKDALVGVSPDKILEKIDISKEKIVRGLEQLLNYIDSY